MTSAGIVLLATLALDLFVAPITAAAQPPTPVYRVGRLSSAHRPSGSDPNSEAFRQGLRDLGWIEGQTILFAGHAEPIYSGATRRWGSSF
jgi:hypothetical protein